MSASQGGYRSTLESLRAQLDAAAAAPDDPTKVAALITAVQTFVGTELANTRPRNEPPQSPPLHLEETNRHG